MVRSLKTGLFLFIFVIPRAWHNNSNQEIAVVICTITKFIKNQKFRIHSVRILCVCVCEEGLNKIFDRNIIIKEFVKDKPTVYHIILGTCLPVFLLFDFTYTNFS